MNQLDNYATPDNLLARISIHEYAVDPNWTRWLFDREMLGRSSAASILDVGCGTAQLWASNIDRIDPSWAITLVDSSAGMIHAARMKLGNRAEYGVADIQELPFPDASFDVVVANHMLYHVPDRERAFSEVSRVLSPGGSFLCSTNGRGHLAELWALLPDSMNIAHHTEEFGLETGPPQLEAFFVGVEVQRFDNSLRIPTAEPVLAYIRSSEKYHEQVDLGAVREVVEAEIRHRGVFSIRTHPGLISCEKSEGLRHSFKSVGSRPRH